MGMVGGGDGAFIGDVHRMAARLDGKVELVCGAFSSNASRSATFGRSLGLEETRCYPDFNTMFTIEAALPSESRMEFVAIVTPNHLHFPIAKDALESGFHVLSDKPATLTLNEALSLKSIIENTGKRYGLTHTYLGYPMIKQAQALVKQGRLGKITKVLAEYQQGWLADKGAETGKQASWRLDPSRAGVSCCMGDIGVHAANLMENVSGLKVTQLCSDLATTVEGRQLDDDGTVLLRFDNGARGTLLASQVATGEENNLTLRVYGEKASLSWQQQEPNSLWLKFNDQPAQCFRTGVGQLDESAQRFTRTPAGHPEGYLEAFANIYSQFAEALLGDTPMSSPGIDDAIRGMAFIENAVAASRSNQKWHPFIISQSPLHNEENI
ncbi:Gfo/Idh/MocA family oxidoreductase [Alteromonas sp. SM 2104]|nr:Gfo/Idh/MocA family oxidoreductase [Alteromonas oceanisediminis]